MNLDDVAQLLMQEWESQRDEQNQYMRAMFQEADIDDSLHLDFAEFASIVQQLDNKLTDGAATRMYREALLHSRGTEKMDIEVFCEVLRNNGLDNPADT
mmetsp:Transcript_54639/g.129092  ORF Transcript_54639/g.129092 Transcript_54639/m.129092 type:complete len:99 (+) Transcript_54639:122-418(+)